MRTDEKSERVSKFRVKEMKRNAKDYSRMLDWYQWITSGRLDVAVCVFLQIEYVMFRMWLMPQLHKSKVATRVQLIIEQHSF